MEGQDCQLHVPVWAQAIPWLWLRQSLNMSLLHTFVSAMHLPAPHQLAAFPLMSASAFKKIAETIPVQSNIKHSAIACT